MMSYLSKSVIETRFRQPNDTFLYRPFVSRLDHFEKAARDYPVSIFHESLKLAP